MSVLAANTRQARTAMQVACKIVLHSGRDLHELTPEDLLGYRAWNMVSDRPTSASVQLVWAGSRRYRGPAGHYEFRCSDSARTSTDR